MVSQRFALATSLSFLCFAGVTHAMGGSEPPEATDANGPSAYQRGVELLEEGKFVRARAALENAVRQDPLDPDALNLLAYSQRKSGQLDEAIETYKQALALRRRFPQAREYLGEAYLEASLRELATLRTYGQTANRETAELLTALKAALSRLPATPPAAQRNW